MNANKLDLLVPLLQLVSCTNFFEGIGNSLSISTPRNRWSAPHKSDISAGGGNNVCEPSDYFLRSQSECE
jgi:hypothetical protein